MDVRALTVSEVNNYIKKSFATDPILSNITVKGEISNFKIHTSGHIYFSLKDNSSRLRCVMFKSFAENLDFIPEEGCKILAKGSISVYERDGQYQLYVREMLQDGLGELYIAFEQLKRKLEGMGYFDDSRKRKIPFIPRRIGIVTSAEGAAIRDIISVVSRRFRNVELLVYNALVQGEKSPAQICRGIEYFNKHERVDVIIIGRGGGSIEELWAFNDERVAHAIYNSQIPVISAVGHQTDFTIADFVADLRAPTPSAAGELVVPDIREVRKNLNICLDRLEGGIFKQVNLYRQKLDYIRNRYGFKQPVDRVEQFKQHLDNSYSRLCKAIAVQRERKAHLLEERAARLDSLSPLAVLERGYAVITKSNTGRVVKSVKSINKGDTVDILLRDGNIEALVSRVNRRGE